MASSQANIAIWWGQAWGTFLNMKAICRSTELPLHLRVRIFHWICLSILLYESEAWSLTKAMTSKLDSFATSCYRYTLGVKKTDRVRHEEILQAVCQKPLPTVIKQRQRRWLVLVLRVTPKSKLTRRYVLQAVEDGAPSPVLEMHPTTHVSCWMHFIANSPVCWMQQTGVFSTEQDLAG